MTEVSKPHSIPALVALRSVVDELERNGLLSHTADTLGHIADDLEEQLEAANAVIKLYWISAGEIEWWDDNNRQQVRDYLAASKI